MTGEAVAAAVAVARDFGGSVVEPVGLADDGELPAAGPVDDLRLGHDLLEREGILTGSVLARLRAELEFLAVEIRAFPVRALHGDAHPGNLLSTPDGLVWNDFEDAWRGPLG